MEIVLQKVHDSHQLSHENGKEERNRYSQDNKSWRRINIGAFYFNYLFSKFNVNSF